MTVQSVVCCVHSPERVPTARLRGQDDRERQATGARLHRLRPQQNRRLPRGPAKGAPLSFCLLLTACLHGDLYKTLYVSECMSL